MESKLISNNMFAIFEDPKKNSKILKIEAGKYFYLEHSNFLR